MNVSFALLLVPLRGIAFQAVGDIVKVGFEIAIVCQTALQLVLVVLLESEIVLSVSIQQIGIYLVAHYFVRNDKLGGTLIFSIYRYQTEIEEQTQEVIRVIDAVGREILYEISCSISLGY